MFPLEAHVVDGHGAPSTRGQDLELVERLDPSDGSPRASYVPLVPGRTEVDEGEGAISSPREEDMVVRGLEVDAEDVINMDWVVSIHIPAIAVYSNLLEAALISEPEKLFVCGHDTHES